MSSVENIVSSSLPAAIVQNAPAATEAKSSREPAAQEERKTKEKAAPGQTQEAAAKQSIQSAYNAAQNACAPTVNCAGVNLKV